jgi:hypothetical protein
MAGILGVVSTAYTEMDILASDTHIMKPITVVSGTLPCVAGEVMGRITLTHKYAKFDPAGVDGSGVACGILVMAVDATLADTKGHAFVQGNFMSSKLVWPVAITIAQKLVALEQLQSRGIICDKDDLEIAV